MGKRILIIEPDERFAKHLVRALHDLGRFDVLVVSHVGEAIMVLRQEQYDVVIFLLSVVDDVVNHLKAVQPNTRLIVTVPTLGFEVPQQYATQIQGVLPESHLEASLGSVLLYVLAQPTMYDEPEVRIEPTETAVPPSATVILSHGSQLLSVWGALTQGEAAVIATQVGDAWPWQIAQTQIQFIELPQHQQKQLLYTRAVRGDYLLTLATSNYQTLRALRERSRLLAKKLRKTLPKNGSLQPRWYAVAWHSQRPLPSILRIPIQRALKRIAYKHHCQIATIYIGKKGIQLLVECPRRYSGQWIAQMFKSQLGQLLHQHWPDLAYPLWQKKHHVQPLTPKQIKKLQGILPH